MNFEHILEHHLIDKILVGPWFVYHGMWYGDDPIGLTRNMVMMTIVAVVLTAMLLFAAHGRGRAALLLRTGLEAVILYIRDVIVHPIFHERTDAYLPYFLTLFMFLFMCNILGLIPFATTVTGNVAVTGALAFCTFMFIQYAGIREQGLFSYIKHLAPSGMPAWVLIIMYPIEILGMGVKCVALTIRLFANMIAGHIVSLAFLSLIFIFAEMVKWLGLVVSPAAVGLALFVYLLDVLVSVLQAYIFTMLTALFVGAAVHPH
jgi:F-type H+-transporting ATPase subunit a